MPLQLEIVTPERLAYSDEIDSVQLPGSEGELGVLPHHAPLVSTLGNAATYMQASGKKAGDIINIGFDTSPQIVQGFKDGWVQLTSDQQPFLQGYMPVLSLCQQVVYGLGAINVDTGAGFVTPDNYEAVAALAIEGLR